MNKLIGRRILIASGFLGLFVGLLFYRLFFLQFLDFDRYEQKAKDQHRLEIELPPARGEILDRHREPLALCVPTQSVYADPRKIPSPKEVAEKLAPVLGRDPKDLFERLSRKKSFVWVQRKLSDSKTEEVKALGLPGIYFLEEPKRYYPKGALLAHVLGFVGIDNEGLEGLEKSLDTYLKGKAGRRVTGRDRKGREIITLRNEEVPPVNGYQVVLTVDEMIQHVAEQELEKVYAEREAQGAIVLVMNPRTGEILALANRPTYNPNDVDASPIASRRNRALTDCYEPGSTFKVITAAAALDEKIISLEETIFCENGAFWHGGHVLHDAHPYGELTFREVIEKSSNIGTAKVSLRLGGPKLYTYIRRFGFGSSTRSGLLGEVEGVVYPPKKWSKYSIVAVPIGQEVAVTAMQMTLAMCAIANDGVLMRPTVIRRIVDDKGSPIEEGKPEKVRRVVSSQTAAMMTEALKGVVTREGTAYRARIPGYTVAGKTGTAQKAIPGEGYARGKYISSFVGFVPASDPQLCIAVIVDEPRGAYYGGVVAAPVFARVAEQTLKILDIPPDNVIKVEKQPQEEETQESAKEG